MNYEIIEINKNTWRIEENQHVRFFLLTGTEKALLIDSGMMIKNARDIAEQLTELPLLLLNTHADPDHIGSNHQFDTFYMHPAEASNYYNTQKRTGTFVPVEQGDVIDLGERPLEIIALPGHTPGSIAVLDVNARVLFSGDPIQDGMIFMFGEQREMHAYRESLRKLEQYRGRFDELYPSHGSLPVSPEMIGQLYEAAGRIMDGEVVGYEINMHGNVVQCCDVGIAKFLISK